MKTQINNYHDLILESIRSHVERSQSPWGIMSQNLPTVIHFINIPFQFFYTGDHFYMTCSLLFYIVLSWQVLQWR